MLCEIKDKINYFSYSYKQLNLFLFCRNNWNLANPSTSLADMIQLSMSHYTLRLVLV